MERNWVSVKQAIEIFNVKRCTIYNWCTKEPLLLYSRGSGKNRRIDANSYKRVAETIAEIESDNRMAEMKAETALLTAKNALLKATRINDEENGLRDLPDELHKREQELSLEKSHVEAKLQAIGNIKEKISKVVLRHTKFIIETVTKDMTILDKTKDKSDGAMFTPLDTIFEDLGKVIKVCNQLDDKVTEVSKDENA